MDDMRGPIERLYRRALLMVGRGRIGAVDDSGPVQKMQVQLGADEIRDNTIREADYGFASKPLPGAACIMVFIGGDRANGCVIATSDERYRPRDLKDGEVMVHDDLGQKIYLTRTGIVVNGGGLPITITNTPKVRIESRLEVTGDIIDHCDDGTGKSMDQMRRIYDAHGHTGVQRGSAKTDPPDQQE